MLATCRSSPRCRGIPRGPERCHRISAGPGPHGPVEKCFPLEGLPRRKRSEVNAARGKNPKSPRGLGKTKINTTRHVKLPRKLRHHEHANMSRVRCTIKCAPCIAEGRCDNAMQRSQAVDHGVFLDPNLAWLRVLGSTACSASQIDPRNSSEAQWSYPGRF